MSKTLIVILLALLALFAITAHKQEKPQSLKLSNEAAQIFQSWQLLYNKQYPNHEQHAYRLEIFAENYAKMIKHNFEDHTWTMGLNQFSDLTQQEFSSIYLGMKVDQQKIDQEINFIPASFNANINWVTKGKVSGIKNQGQCGSCWAFATTGDLESLTAIKTGNMVSYSEQQLVDCSGAYGNQGCNGGLPTNAFKYIMQYGIEKESDYPYNARDGSCKYDASKAQKIITGYTNIPAGNCNQLQTALGTQPIAIGVDAQNWSAYAGGVFNNCRTSIDHGVLLVGVTDSYWLVKNSWGTSWGEQGFIRLSTGNTCAICNQATTGNL